MPRMPADAEARLVQLRAARKALGRKTVAVNADELGAIVGLTWRRLKQIVDGDPAFPVIARGGMGTPWQFDAGAVLDHLLATAEAAQAERKRRVEKVNRLSGLTEAGTEAPANGQVAAGGSAAELLQQARAISTMIDVQAKVRSEKQKQGRLVEVDAVKALLWEIMSTMQTETLAVSGKLDPAGQWEPTLRAQVDEALRNALVHVRDRLDEKLGKLGGPSR